MAQQTSIGVLVAPEGGAARVTLRAGGETHRRRLGDRLTLTLDDGTTLPVALSDRTSAAGARLAVRGERRDGALAAHRIAVVDDAAARVALGGGALAAAIHAWTVAT